MKILVLLLALTAIEPKQRITVTWGPSSYPNFVTNNVDPKGRPFRSITMNVITQDKSRAVFKLNDNDDQVWRPERWASVHSLRYPAGVGKHYVEVWITYEDGTTKYIDRRFAVYRAPKKERRR